MVKSTNIILLVVLSLYLFLFGLGKMALTDPDEVFYAETAKEMFKRSEWLTPCIFGKPQFEKPPLYYWLEILSYKIFGINEFSARFPSAIFGVLGIIGIYLLGALLFSEKTAFYASVIMATAVEYIILSRSAVTDMVLCVLILYGFFFCLYPYLENHKKGFFYIGSIFFALAVLTKGPIGVILPVFILVLYLLLKKDLKAMFKFPTAGSIIIFLAISVPWYYFMYKFHGRAFTDHFFGFQNIIRFIEPEHEIGDVFYFYIPVIFAGFFPWSIFLPYGAYKIIKEDRKKYAVHLFLIIWIMVFLIFFSISRTKLITYIFPLFPALAILIGRFLESEFNNKNFSKGFAFSCIAYLVGIPIGFIGLLKLSFYKYPEMVSALFKSSIIILILFLVSLSALIKRNKKYFFSSLVFALGIALLPFTFFITPCIDLYESSKGVSAYLEKATKPDERIGAETDYRRGVVYYMDREDVIDVHPHHVITKFMESKERVWAVMKDKNHRQLYLDAKKPYKTPTYMVFKEGKRVVITNKIPDDGKFIKKRSIENPI